MCICIYVCMYVYIYIYICVCTYVCMYVYMSLSSGNLHLGFWGSEKYGLKYVRIRPNRVRRCPNIFEIASFSNDLPCR